MTEHLVQLGYLGAAGLFILSLMWMSRVETARRGVRAAELGMLLAVVGTLIRHEIVNYELIALAFLVGSAIGVPLAYLMPMTAIPQRTAISHAFGALATGLIGTAEYYRLAAGGVASGSVIVIALMFEMALGFLTFTASLMAFGKLQELMPTRPITFRGQRIVNLGIFLATIVLGAVIAAMPDNISLFPAFAALSLMFGFLLIVPIGGADMPTVIALLNAYAGLAASAMGFALGNKLLVITGALDGSSGFILAVIMCKAMNRSFVNVLFGGFGQIQQSGGTQEKRSVRASAPDEAALTLDGVQTLVVIPGYGMAVAQAQHKIHDLFQQMTGRGISVKFAIHPVAGRMPGHMNVLLAEANIPYDNLVEMEDINPEMPTVDVALVVGANDVVNPAARDDPKSVIAGMPIIEADRARSVMVVKRGMSPGFAGIDNELYYLDKTQMLFGDAKEFVGAMVKELNSDAA
ncbi:MAG TPA: NAD(P)(+) transhydrogenase (Re/Si-specific) subunit beta [Alphaproteobacteria bacterium]|nr:NAD(P)(+) transhydrogenase (Re/Si-specific) subunit beta [Alphaproteobacteria bacterium]